jgi:hypothetical protein
VDSYKFIDGVYVYFVTFTVVDWQPVFIDPEPIEIINNSLLQGQETLREHGEIGEIPIAIFGQG